MAHHVLNARKLQLPPYVVKRLAKVSKRTTASTFRENGDCEFLRNTATHLPNYKASDVNL
jgi:hypothetical protein